jgi:hypothetical protein
LEEAGGSSADHGATALRIRVQGSYKEFFAGRRSDQNKNGSNEKSHVVYLLQRGGRKKKFLTVFFFGPNQKPTNLDAKRIEFYSTKTNG